MEPFSSRALQARALDRTMLPLHEWKNYNISHGFYNLGRASGYSANYGETLGPVFDRARLQKTTQKVPSPAGGSIEFAPVCFKAGANEDWLCSSGCYRCSFEHCLDLSRGRCLGFLDLLGQGTAFKSGLELGRG